MIWLLTYSFLAIFRKIFAFFAKNVRDTQYTNGLCMCFVYRNFVCVCVCVYVYAIEYAELHIESKLLLKVYEYTLLHKRCLCISLTGLSYYFDSNFVAFPFPISFSRWSQGERKCCSGLSSLVVHTKNENDALLRLKSTLRRVTTKERQIKM